MSDQNKFAAALLDPSLALPDGISSARQEACASRFAVYRNNVAVSLTTALSQRFPVVKQLVGDQFFNGMARAFIAVSPPQSPLIFAYGDDFPEFVEHFAPAAAVPYLADVGRLEAAWTRAYHAGDVLAAPLEVLTGVAPDRIETTRFRPHAAATILRSNFAIGTIWQGHQHGSPGAISVGHGEWVTVSRPAFEVRVYIIPEADGIFGLALLGGATIGDAAQAAFNHDGAFNFGRALVGLISLGAFSGVETE